MEVACKKVAFADENRALFYVDKLIRTSKRKVVPHRAYLCEKCLAWHLTSRIGIEEKLAKKDREDREEVFETKLAKEELKKENLKLKSRVAQLEKESSNRKKKIDELHEQIYDLNRLSGRFKKAEDLLPKKD